MSQRTAIERLGEVKDIDAEIKRIQDEEKASREASRIVDVFHDNQ